jgi:hypothetical protein
MDEEEFIVDEKDIRGLHTSSSIVSVKDDENYWTVLLTYRTSRSEDLETWERKEVIFKIIDTDIVKAVGQANFTLELLLRKYDYDLFNAPEDEIKTEHE